jgi:hypothetical protein
VDRHNNDQSEKFEDTKGVARSQQSKKDKQHNGQKEGQTTQWSKRRTFDIKKKICSTSPKF